jgi:hypothetical protein
MNRQITAVNFIQPLFGCCTHHFSASMSGPRHAPCHVVPTIYGHINQILSRRLYNLMPSRIANAAVDALIIAEVSSSISPGTLNIVIQVT